MDAKAIIEVLSNSNKTNFIISSIVDDCRQLASQIPQTRFNHCYREANRCADALAKIGSQQILDFILYDNPPVDLQTLQILIALACILTDAILRQLFFNALSFLAKKKKKKKESIHN